MPKVTLSGARVSAGYSQAELAEKLGVSRDSIAKWESGKVRMKTVNLFAFCMATGFEPADIILPNESTKRRLEGAETCTTPG